MTRTSPAGALLTAVLLLGGCASAPRYSTVETGTRVQAPEPGTSLIYFIRDGRLIGPNAIVLDGDKYIGELPGWGHIAYVTTPGKHRFAVVSEAADFMEADLQPDKTYYANVRRRTGVWVSRFSFVAHNDQESIDVARESVRTTPQVCANDVARDRHVRQRTHIKRLLKRYYPVWETNPTRQVLAADAGR